MMQQKQRGMKKKKKKRKEKERNQNIRPQTGRSVNEGERQPKIDTGKGTDV
jgi:hypothetical protein